MKIKTATTGDLPVQERDLAYKSPDISLVEINSECILCMSGQNEEFKEETIKKEQRNRRYPGNGGALYYCTVALCGA